MKKKIFNIVSNKLSFKNKGFTLIELMVVIAIIAILSTIVMANFGTAKAKARDSKRVSDIAQLQLALELGFDRCNKFPIVDTSGGGSLVASTPICTVYTVGSFSSKVPTDAGTPYTYKSDSAGTTYILRATLEQAGGVLDDDIDVTILTDINCDDGSKYYCVK